VTLSWSGSAAKYNVHRGSPGFVPSESNRIATVSTTSHRDTSANMFASNSNVGLSGFQTYAYAVVAVSNTGGVPSAAPPSVTITTPGAKVFSDGFDSVSDSQWVPYSGTWTISGSAYNQTTANCGPGCIIPAMTAISGRTWGDMVAEFTVKITDNGGNSQNWAGLAFHKTNQADGLLVSGYLVFLRSDGTLELLESSLGQLDQMSTGLGPFNTPRRIRIETNQRYVRVFVDGILFIDWPEGTPLDVSDFNTPSWPTPGYVDLTTYGVQAQYLDMSIFFHDSFNRSFTFASGSPSSNWKLLPATSSYDVDRPNQLRLKPDGILQWTTPQALFVKDFTADFTVRIESPVNQTDWGGFTFRKQNQDDDSFVGGYTVFLRANGELDLFKAVVGTVATATVAPCPAAGQGCTSSPCAHQIRVSAVGNRIRVYSDGVQLIDWTDAASTYLQGYTSLAAYGSGNGTSCRFEGIEVF